MTVSKFELVDEPDRELKETEEINGLIYRRVPSVRKEKIVDQVFQKIYRIHDHKTEISFLNMKKKFVIDLMEACR